MRKYVLPLMAGLLAISMQISAQNCADLFKRANSLRDEGYFADAMTYYQRAKECDPNLTADCDRWIKYCRKHLPALEISEQEVYIPYQGGDKQIEVKATGTWEVDGSTEWCNTDSFDSKNLVIQCRSVNNNTRSKRTTIVVKSGSLYKTVKVIQEGRPEYIEVGAQNLSFPSKGAEDVIRVESNAHWDVSSVPSWCRIEKGEDGVHVIVTPNNRVLERVDDIVIVSPSKSVKIRVCQGAGEEHLTMSRNNLIFKAEGDVQFVKVYTDADNWFVGDYPTWMNVQKMNGDSLRIECVRNIPNGESRSGSVLIRTDRQTAGVMVSQSPLLVQDLVFSNLVGGHNISLGISASCYIPFVATSAGGDYVGSVVDYGLGTSEENASYKSAIGYSFGLFADIRLFKNIYLIAGVNFSQIKYDNEFNKNTVYTVPRNPYEYMKGELQNSYREKYSHSMLEVPILASYRFTVNEISHVQLNLGPVINFGLSSSMDFSGNSDCETMKVYNSITHQLVDNNNYIRHTGLSTKFNLYQPCVYWEEMYTAGNDAAVPHHDKFQSAPFRKINCGLRFGIAYEWAGISFGISYTQMLTNMAQKNYWGNERWTVLNVSDNTMKGYSHRLNMLELKLAYTMRYIKINKKGK